MTDLENEIEKQLLNNLIYCRDTHSFVHRLFNKFQEEEPDNYKYAQILARQVLGEMVDDLKEDGED